MCVTIMEGQQKCYSVLPGYSFHFVRKITSRWA